MPDKLPLSRRRFLQTAGGASALAAVPYFVPASAPGRDGAVAPSERIVVGGIGIQHRGMHDLGWIMRRAEVQFVAICDLQKKQRLAVKEVVDKHYGTNDCATYPEITGFQEALSDASCASQLAVCEALLRCAEALETAERDTDKRLVLEVLLRYPSEKMKAIALEAADNPALKEQALLVVMGMASQGVNRAELGKALLEAGQTPVELEILKAEYGAGTKIKDVTAILRKYAKNYRTLSLPSASYNESFEEIRMPPSLAQIYVHIVFFAKDRKPWLRDDGLRDQLDAHMASILRDNVDSPALLINGVGDHVHTLIRMSRKFPVMNVLQESKVETSKWLKRQATVPSDFAWQAGYAAFSVSASMLEEVKHYIQNQREHHRRMSFQDEFRELCRRHGLELDERSAWD